MGDNRKNGENRQISVTPRVVLIFAICVGIIMILMNIDAVNNLVSGIFGMLSPVFIGVIIAYIINPLYKIFYRAFLRRFLKNGKISPQKAEKHSRRLGIFLTVFLMIAVIVALLFLVIPEFTANIQILIERVPGLISQTSKWLKDGLSTGNPATAEFRANIYEFVDGFGDSLSSWITGDAVKTIVNAATSGVISIVSFVFNFVVAIIVCVYALLERDKFIAQGKKLVFALFSPEKANYILSTARYGNEVFGKFLSGKLLTSTVLGIVTFIFMTLAGLPYSLLSSVIVAVTNVIPFFGPVIGGVITAFIILITDFRQGIIYIIYILIAQQIEGNIVEPMILEDKTGVSKFWVTFALLLFGGMFGIAGMIFAVPLFAVIYYCAKIFVERRLEEKSLPLSSDAYLPIGEIDPNTNQLLPNPPEEHTKKPKISIKSFFAALLGKKVTEGEAEGDSRKKPKRNKKSKK